LEKVEAFIFDLDGVLVDTAVYHYKGWKRLADQLGILFSEQENEKLKGISREESLDILLSLGSKSYSPEEKSEMAAMKNEWYLSYVNEIQPGDELPGARSVLEECRKRSIKIGLGSSSKNAKRVLKLTELAPYFDAVVDGTMIKKAKPDPELFLLGAEMLGVGPHQCVVFEDAEAGIQAAINGGMHTVGVGTSDTLNKADYKVESLAKLDFSQLPFPINH
jgi:beta-phosphoglucomutase